jgi:indolepyruvate ferredoxin oxidoreductase, alpha subunit
MMHNTAFLSGSQAIARGAYQAGVRFVSGYAGDPTTEILRAASDMHAANVQWTPNEKVALEVALGIARGGSRALAVLKHIGLNIAADPLVASAYTGVNAGLVIVAIDDPGLLSSLSEQDTRHLARAAKLPMLSPSDTQEALDFLSLAFSMSERYDLPVIVHMTHRLCHMRGVCRLSEPVTSAQKTSVLRTPLTALEGLNRHTFLEKQLGAIETFANQAFEFNTIDVGSPDIGIITSGIAYAYAKEVFPEASYLKLGITHPIPQKLLSYFASLVKRLYVIEELDPFLEEQLQAFGLRVAGKDVFPRTGELTPEIVAKGLEKEGARTLDALTESIPLPSRQSNQCHTCMHRGLMNVFLKMNLQIVGDIGCFSPGELPPADPEEMDACFCIGASMSIAYGMSLAQGGDTHDTVTIVSGSTFMHSGLPALANIVENDGTATVCILASPSHDGAAHGAKAIDYGKLCEGIGVQSIRTVAPDDESAVEEILKEELPRPGVSVIISMNESVHETFQK